MNQTKLIFVPWGATDYGVDVRLLEHALVFCLQSAIEMLPPRGSGSYADLYDQLEGETARTAAVPPFADSDIARLAARAPGDVNAIVDGLITAERDPDTFALRSVEIAPRIFILRDQAFALPDAFVFDGFAAHSNGRAQLCVSDIESFFRLCAALAVSILDANGVAPPSDFGAEKLSITRSWDAFRAFVTAKRLARTANEKRAAYRKAIEADPNFFWALFNDGLVLKSQSEFAAARKRFMEAARAAKGEPELLGDAYFEMGLASVALGDPKTARNFWDQALDYAPNSPALLINIAGTFEQESDFERAAQINRKVLEIDPDSHKAIVSLGRLAALLGDMPAAIGYYRRAVELQPDDALRQAILGGCYLAVEDYESARTHLEIAARLDPARARLAPVEGSDALDEVSAPGEYARQELAKLGDGIRAQSPRL